MDELQISFMEADCESITLTDNTDSLSLTCTLPVSVDTSKLIAISGDWLPKVHFKNIGYALTTGLTPTVINPTISLLATVGS